METMKQEGKAFPCGAEAEVLADPLCGDTHPSRPRECEGCGYRRDGLRVEREAPGQPVAGDLR